MKRPKLEEMTLREKIGQTVIFRHSLLEKIEDIPGYFTENPIGANWTQGLPREAYRVVEALRDSTNLSRPRDELFINYINTINQYMRIPVLPVMDAANGIAESKFEGHAELPTAASLGAANDPELAWRYGKCLGDDLYSIGFRWIWSPVADNAGHCIGTRSLCCNIEDNCKLLTAFIKGMQAAGVATGAKHFPGADPYEYRDSHFCTAAYSQSFEYWQQTQGREFQACIDAGADSIMIGHKTFRAVDDTRINGALLPCTLSYKVITELLKERMGFQGVVLTDDVNMKALTAIYPQEKLYVELLRAGNDMILGPVQLDYVDIVEQAVRSGDLSESRIDDACRRVLDLKEKYGLFDQGELPHPTEARREQIRQNIHALSRQIAAKGLTITANRTGFVPVDPAAIRRVKIVYIGYSDVCYENLSYAAREFKRHGAVCDIQRGFQKEDNETLERYDLIVYATFIGFFAPAGGRAFFGPECHMMRQIMTTAVEKSVGVSFGDTDIFFNYFTAVPTFVNCYSYNPETMEGFVRGLYGEISFTHYNPYPLNPITRTDDVYA